MSSWAPQTPLVTWWSPLTRAAIFSSRPRLACLRAARLPQASDNYDTNGTLSRDRLRARGRVNQIVAATQHPCSPTAAVDPQPTSPSAKQRGNVDIAGVPVDWHAM